MCDSNDSAVLVVLFFLVLVLVLLLFYFTLNINYDDLVSLCVYLSGYFEPLTFKDYELTGSVPHHSSFYIDVNPLRLMLRLGTLM